MNQLRPTMRRFRDSADVEYWFQQELNKFPVVDGRSMLSEFGVIMLRPIDEPKKRLTHLFFPETILSAPFSASSLTGYSSRRFPQTLLMADAEKNLYVKVMADWITEYGFTKRISVVLSMQDVFFSTDIWHTIPNEDRVHLAEHGFGPEMSFKGWATAINSYKANEKPMRYATNVDGEFIFARELSIVINKLGQLGTLNSYHLMPDFTAAALETNRFVHGSVGIPSNEEEVPFEIGSAHIHPTFDELSPEQHYVADVLGEEVVRRTPSIADISDMRASRAIHRRIYKTYRNRDINTWESFLGIVNVDFGGRVTGSRYFDLGSADIERVVALNDKAESALSSSSPDYDAVLEHYRYFDSISEEDFGNTESSPHVGDPDYDRTADDTIKESSY